jgi:deoxyribodipyrimidine photolyase-related protein
VVRLVLVLGDQLSEAVAALGAADRAQDVVVMAEVMAEAAAVRHHVKKIAFTFAAMRKFAARLEAAGWRVLYSRLDDPDNSQSIPGELLRRAAETGAGEVLATEPGDWRLCRALEAVPIGVRILEDDRFLASHRAFEDWAKGRRQLRMEYFYREMRRRTGLLMEGADPAGGQWNYDAENRRPARGEVFVPPLRFEPDAVTQEVLALVEARFPAGPGQLEPFWFATDREGALAQFGHWLATGLPRFGDHQDAMLRGEGFLAHSVISLYLNTGLLGPMELCRAVEAEWRAGRAPLNAAEGYIRQIIGWREYLRGIWWREGPDYVRRNALGHGRALPALYWGAPTDMACMAAVTGQTLQEAYAHHIQRLMVTGNFALLAGIDPFEVHEWYLTVYADAHEWVEAPNVIGMSQFADGGIVASKPYVSSGAYIERMSDYCGGCAYDVRVKAGEGRGARACPFNLLYWDFIGRHAERFRSNPRMAQIVRSWERMEPARQAAIRAEAGAFLARMEAGEPV